MPKNSKNRMIYIANDSTDPHYNLAFEEYVFRNVAQTSDAKASLQAEEEHASADRTSENISGVPVLLLWQNAPSVIIGSFQNTIEEINYDYINDNGINVVRRNTGGGAVYHDLGNLNYSFIIPDLDTTTVDFKTFTIPVIKALNSMGIPAEQTGRNDIVVEGKKFSGNAQQFAKGKLLHHGTLMFDVDPDAVSASLKVKPGKFKSKSVKSVRSRVTNLKPFFDASEIDDVRNMDVEGFKQTLLEWFSREYDLEELRLTDQQLADIDALKAEKYDTYEWNFGRSPKADVVRGEFFRCGFVEFHFQIEDHSIKSLKLVGDFFASKDIEEFEAMFEGCDYSREALQQVLEDADLAGYLGDVTAEELLAVIV